MILLFLILIFPVTSITSVPQRVDFYGRLSNSCNLTPVLLKSIAKVESGENPKALSKDGSYGLFQVQLSTARFMGFKGKVEDLYNPEINANIACKYLRYLQSTRMNIWKSLDAYNRGPGNELKNPWEKPWKEHPYVGKILSKMEEINDSNSNNERW